MTCWFSQLLFGLYYKYCLYFKYCVENFLNDSIIRPVQRQFQKHYKYKYCLYYKYCLIFNVSIAMSGAVLRAYLILNIHISYCVEIFW